MVNYHGGFLPTREELEDIVIADIVLSVGFALVISGGIAGASQQMSAFVYLLPITFVAVTLSFVLHEYMHKIVAQHFGAVAAFRKSTGGLLITAISSAFGFLIGLPGATVIYTNRFTAEQEGYVSLAGPLTNFMIFLIFFSLSIFYGGALKGSYIFSAVTFTMFIAVLLAFFNMLPLYPLDGSKILRWNKAVFAVMIGLTFIFFFYAATALGGVPVVEFMVNLVLLMAFALVVSSFAGGLMRL